jgi:hypothetical protein
MNNLRAVIEVTDHPDYDPDLSWLDQTDAEMGAGWEDDARRRKEGYRRGDWYMLSVLVKATITGEVNGRALTREEYNACGGIESDSDSDYLREVAGDLKAELISDLRDWYPGIEIEEEG